jgi:hypothetical protein
MHAMSTEDGSAMVALDPDATPARTPRGGTGAGTIAAMVQGTLVAERQALERMAADLRAELVRLQEWQTRDQAMRTDQTALYRQAADYWQAAGEHAMSLCEGVVRLEGITQVLQAAVEAAIARFWRRAMLAAGLLALVGMGLIAGLCGVVWLALAQR